MGERGERGEGRREERGKVEKEREGNSSVCGFHEAKTYEGVEFVQRRGKENEMANDERHRKVKRDGGDKGGSK
jgi:hypothetical protein